VSLIARHYEKKGLPTLILGSAFDILKAGMPPRGLFLNYPLGFETGKPFDKKNQFEVVESALAIFESFEQPGIKTIEYEWQAGCEMTLERARAEGEDSRSPRDTTPKYQNAEDKRLAEMKINN
jgi:hypothetical protein